MPKLENKRHEAFCLGVASGKSLRKAYMDAGYNCKPSAADGSAAALKRNPLIQDRIAELSDQIANLPPEERAVITKQWLENKVQDLAKKAEELGNLAVAKACYELLGRDRGVFQENRNITVRSIREMTSEEIEGLLADLGAGTEAEGDSGSKGRTKAPPARTRH